jgi:hypothetical protein
MPQSGHSYTSRRDPLDAMRVFKWVTRLIAYPAVALAIPLDHFLLGPPRPNSPRRCLPDSELATAGAYLEG